MNGAADRHVDYSAVNRLLVGKLRTGLVEWTSLHRMSKEHELATPEGSLIPQCVDADDEAIAWLRNYHARWRMGNENWQSSAGLAKRFRTWRVLASFPAIGRSPSTRRTSGVRNCVWCHEAE